MATWPNGIDFDTYLADARITVEQLQSAYTQAHPARID
jgi:hypothetical protein